MISILTVASPAAPTNSAWSLRVWQSDDGLPNNNVTALAQTPDGYLWLATPGWLARFDGDQFEGFGPNQFAAGYKQRITIIVGSRDGGLWLPLDRGPVIRMNGGAAQIFTNDVPEPNVETAIEDGDGALWVSYRGGSLCRIKDGKVHDFSAMDGFPETSGGCFLAKDNQGRVWIAKTGIVAMFRNGRFETRLPTRNAATRLTGARDGGMWICSGLDFYKCDESGNLKKLGSMTSDTPGTMATALMEDASGAVWIGTSASGLFRYGGSQLESVPTSHRKILSLLEDREGNIWAGTAGGGLDRIQPRIIELQGVESGLPLEGLQSLCQDRRGTIWAVTQSGLLVHRADGVWNRIPTNSDWHGESVECVTADRDGGVWIGGRNRLLYQRDGNFLTWSAADGLSNHIIRALLFSTKGELWVGGSALERMRNGILAMFPLPRGTQLVRAMAEDSAGNVWLGTANGFLLRVADDRISDETAGILGAPDSIRCLTATPDGSLWIGFATDGIGRLKDGKLSRIRTAQGLGDDGISQILPDGSGWFWIGADHGIFKVRQMELDAVADGTMTRVHAVHCGRDEGLFSLQAGFGFTPEALRTRDGRLWMPMTSALASIDPAQLPDNPNPPSVLLKRVMADDQALGIYGGVMPVGKIPDLQKRQSAPRLPPGRHRLEFEFTALDFTAPENVQFRYRLTGVDDDWIDGKNQRNAGYPGLTAGHYQFEISARRNGGAWNTNAATFAFSIRPFLWETWWFWSAALAIFTGGVVAACRYASFRRLQSKVRLLKQQAALEKERARIAKDIHDDLGGSLTHAALLLDLALQDRDAPGKTGAHVQRAAATVKQIAESIDEIVWAANPRNDTLADLNDYISLFATQFLQAANIRCRIDSPRPLPDRVLSPEIRHSLFLVAKEAINNVVRHARAGKVRLLIVVTDETLKINITDDGHGFNGEQRGHYCSDGLRNMKQRMAEIGGQFSVESKPEAGTTVSAVYFWPRQK
jgi:signal transduction histidine kinase/ligand-binding sensor domain-containing protein